MNKSTLRKWSRDALETIHQLKHETNDASTLAKRHAHRVVALIDMLNSIEKGIYITTIPAEKMDTLGSVLL